MTYRVLLTSIAQKDLAGLPRDVARRIVERITRLAENPRPPGCKKLAAAANLWRIRIGNYRAAYSIDDQLREVLVEYIRHRKDMY